MTENVIDKFRPWFGFLIEQKSFQVCPPGDLEFVADGHVELKATASAFKIRLIIDRGEPFVEIAPNAADGEWFDLALVRSLTDGGEFLQVSDVSLLGKFLEDSYDQVSALFAASNWTTTLKNLKDLERKRASEMFPRAFGESG